MSSPHGGFSDDDNDENDGDRGNRPPAPGGGDDPGQYRYRPTSHPEDSDSFTYPGYGMGYGQGYRGSFHAQAGPQEPAGEQGTGSIEVMRAIAWGFGQAYRNWRVWLLGVVAVVVVSGAAGIISGAFTSPGANPAGAVFGTALNLLISLAMVAIGIFALRGALHQIDDPAMGWGHFLKDVNFWPTLLLQFLIGLITSALLAVTAGPVIVGSLGRLADPTAVGSLTEQELMGAVGAIFTAVGIVLLVSVLINPLVVFMPYYLVERRADFKGAIAQGFRAGARNYLRLLATYVVAGILGILAITLTFGLAAVFLIGPWYLGQAHMYRQAAGGSIPAR